MFRTIRWYSSFAIALIGTIPALNKVKMLEEKGLMNEKIELVNKISSNWAMQRVKLSGADVEITGLENIPSDKSVLFVSNHQGNFDIALFMSYINKPKGYIAKIEMKKIPILRTWMEHLNCVFMDRSSIRKSAQSISEGVEILKNGYSLVIFPEGTRSKSNKIGNFKDGSFKLATKSKVPIIPVTIDGSYKLMEANNNKIKPANVKMYIHKMINTDKLNKEELENLPSTVKNIISSKL